MNAYPFDVVYLQRLKDGDPEVERHFAAYFGEFVENKLRGRIRDPQLVEDVRQETLLRVLRVIRKQQGVQFPERFGGFVAAVTHNVACELSRGAHRHPQMEENLPDPPDPWYDPDRDLNAADQKRAVAGILNQMNAKDRRVLRWCFLEEWDREEVCRRENVSPEYLRVLIHRAISRFKKIHGQTRDAAGANR